MRDLNEQVWIEASLDDVWRVIADFGGVHKWAPYMKTCALVGDRAAGPGTRRSMRHSWGFRFEEVATEWDEPRSIAFDVLSAPYPMTRVKERWVLEPSGAGTLVRSRVTYDMRLGPLGSTLDSVLVNFIVTREMRAGLEGLKRYVERVAQDSATPAGAG